MKKTNRNINIPASTPLRVRVIADMDPDAAKVPYSGTMVADGRLQFQYPDCAPGAGGGNVQVDAPGYETWTGRTLIPNSGEIEDPEPAIELQRSAHPNPFFQA